MQPGCHLISTECTIPPPPGGKIWQRCEEDVRHNPASLVLKRHRHHIKKIINFKNSGDRTHYEKSIAQHKSRWGDSRQCLQLTTGGRLALITHAKPDCHGANRRLEKADCTHTYRCEKIKMQRNEAFVKCTLMSLCTGQLARGGLNPHTHIPFLQPISITQASAILLA